MPLSPTIRGETFKSLIEAGIAAPSADNSQPWQHKIVGDTLQLHIDPSRSGGISDQRFVLSDLAAGATLENMVLRSAELGIAAEITYFPDSNNPSHVANVQLRTGDVSDPADMRLAAFIHDRHTNRTFPFHGVVAAKVQEHLNAQATSFQGISLLWLNKGNPQRSRALRLMHRAETLRFKSRRLHSELFGSIRFSAGWHQSTDEGLAPATLAVEPAMRALFSRLQSWTLVKAAGNIGLAPVLGFRVAVLPNILSPGLCLLCTRDSSRRGLVETGRALQRIWLQATAEGLSVQPFAACGIYALGFANIEPEFSNEIKTLAAGMEQLATNSNGIIFLRLGASAAQRIPRTSRRHPASFEVN